MRSFAKQDELKRGARGLQIFKLRRAALEPRGSGQDASQPPQLAGDTHTDYVTLGFCRSIAMEIVRATLKRVDNRAELESVQKCALQSCKPAMDLANGNL